MLCGCVLCTYHTYIMLLLHDVGNTYHVDTHLKGAQPMGTWCVALHEYLDIPCMLCTTYLHTSGPVSLWMNGMYAHHEYMDTTSDQPCRVHTLCRAVLHYYMDILHTLCVYHKGAHLGYVSVVQH